MLILERAANMSAPSGSEQNGTKRSAGHQNRKAGKRLQQWAKAKDGHDVDDSDRQQEAARQPASQQQWQRQRRAGGRTEGESSRSRSRRVETLSNRATRMTASRPSNTGARRTAGHSTAQHRCRAHCSSSYD